ncbi:hypothetical protein Bca4012_042756 [Brassica carinata]
MEVSTLELPIHKHPLYPSTRFLHARCEGCRVRGHIYGGYRCNDSGCYNNANPGGWFHKECGESPSEINHPSHPEHPLTFNAKTELESYDFHDHPAVYYNDKKASPRCRACHQRGGMSQHMLSCDDCDFALDFRCFNLPRVVKHKDDEPPLSLCYGEDPNGKTLHV